MKSINRPLTDSLTLPIDWNFEPQDDLISVVLPSRKRKTMLHDSIESLVSTSDNPAKLEFLVAYDLDDVETGEYVINELTKEFTKSIIDAYEAPLRYGYFNIAYYYTMLLEKSSGSWFLPSWGDDGLMQTKGWDTIVRETNPINILYTRGNPDGFNCYPVVSRHLLEVTGNVFPSLPAIDTWYDDIAHLADIWKDPGITIIQDRFDYTGNNNDETYREGRTGYRSEEYYTDRFTKERQRTAERILDYINGNK